MRVRSLFFVILILFLFPLSSFSTTYYAIQNGDWDDVNTWSVTQGGASCGCIPAATDDVVVDGYRVDIDAANVSINSIVITANVRNAPAHLLIENGQTLNVTTSLSVNSPNNINQAIELLINDDNSTINILGNLIFSRPATNTSDNKLGLGMTNETYLNVSGDIVFDYLNSLNESYDEINISNKSYISCQNLYLTFSGGTDFNIVISDSSRININTNFDIDINGGDDMLITLNNTSTFNEITVGGDVNIDKSDGGAFMYTSYNNSDMKVSGDMYFSVTGISGPNWEDIEFELNNNSVLDIDGNFIFTMDIGTGFNTNNYLIFDLDHSSKLYVGDPLTPTIETFTLNMLNGWGYDIYIDRDALIQIYGNVDIDYDIDGSAWIYMNQSDDGSSADAQFRVSDNMNIDVDGLGLRNFKILMNNDADFEIGNDLTVDMVCTGDWLAYEVVMGDEAGFTIGRDYLFTMNNPGKEYEVRHIIDGDAFIDIGRDNTVNLTSDHSYSIIMNQTADGIASDAQYSVGGDYSFTQTKGSSPLFEIHKDADFNVSGNFTYTVNGYENAWETITFDLDGDAGINVSGNAAISNYGPGTEDEYSYFYLDGNSSFNIDGDLTINHTAGDDLLINMNQAASGLPASDSAKIAVGGNFIINKSDGDEFHILMNEEAKIVTGGNFDINITGFDADSHEFDFDIEDNSSVDINGNFTYNISSSVNSYSYINIEDEAKVEIGISPSDLSKNMSLNSVSSTRDIQFDLDDNATLTVYGDLNMIKTSGQKMYFHLNEHTGTSAAMTVYGDLVMNNADNDNIVEAKLYGSNSRLYVYGNIDFTNALSASRVEVEANSSSEIGIGGDFLRNPCPANFGVLDCNDSSTLSFIGTDNTQNWPMEYSNDIQDFTFQNIRINNTYSSSPQVVLQENTDYLPVTGTIDFTNGIIDASVFRLEINNHDVAAIFNYSENSYVYGSLRRYTSGLVQYDFPVGSADYYEPATINFTANTPGYLDARFTVSNENPVPGPPYITVSGTAISDFLDYGYWTISPDAGTPTYDITLTSRGHTNGGTLPEQHAVFKRDPGSGIGPWSSAGIHDNSTQSGFGTNPVTVKRSAITGFSDFIIGRSSLYPLPVELTNFTVEYIYSGPAGVLINWTTASETNNSHFEIQKSPDGINFESCGQVAGNINSSTVINYSYTEPDPYEGISYYRIKQVDLDGGYTFSSTRHVYIPLNNKALSVYPNPCRGFLYISGLPEGDVSISIKNTEGQVVFSKNIYNQENRTKNISLSHLQTGVYLISIITKNTTDVKKLVIN